MHFVGPGSVWYIGMAGHPSTRALPVPPTTGRNLAWLLLGPHNSRRLANLAWGVGLGSESVRAIDRLLIGYLVTVYSMT